MSENTRQLDDASEGGPRAERVSVYLDGAEQPLAEYTPPARIELDTRQLEDGRHELRIEADAGDGPVGSRHLSFEVRNGPAISVEGLGDGDVVNGELGMVVHAWGGAGRGDWEPKRAESPAPIPTWAWVLLIGITAWAIFYSVSYWQPPEPYRDSPTYRSSPADTSEEN